MNYPYRPPIIALLICAYCAYNSVNLLQTWHKSPAERYGIAALIIWLIPIVFFWVLELRKKQAVVDRPILLGLALLCSFHGKVGSLHILEHIGLACAFSALIPKSWIHILWLISSLSWMPALSWIGGRFFPDYILPVRLLMAILPAGYLTYKIKLSI